MNAELVLLAKILDERDYGPVLERGLDDSWFLASSTAWDFITKHVETYGALPSREVFLESVDVELPSVAQVQEVEFDWAIDRLREQLITYGLRTISAAIDKAIEEGVHPDLILSQVMERSYGLSTKYEDTRDVDILHEFGERYELTKTQAAAFTENHKPRFIQTGFKSIDTRAPFMSGELITLLGDTGSLKSYFTHALGVQIAKQKHVVLVSLEMTRNEVGWRVDAITGEGNLSNRGMIVGDNVNLQEYQSHLKDRSEESEYGFWVIDTKGTIKDINSGYVLAKFDHYARKYGEDLGLFILDYTVLLDDATDWQEIKRITRRLKNAAERLGVPCLQIAQAKRGQRGREITRDDAGYSWGQVEDSDKIFTITREQRGYLRVLCDKNRKGEEGWSFMVRVDPDKGSFQEVESAVRTSFSD